MRPLWHVLTTTVGYLILDYFFGLDIIVLVYALVLTLGIDVLDHTASLFLINHRMRKAVLPLMMRGQVLKAYKFYATHRFAYNRMLLHKWVFFLLWIVAAVYLWSPVVFLGLVLHYALDVCDSWRYGCVWKGF